MFILSLLCEMFYNEAPMHCLWIPLLEYLHLNKSLQVVLERRCITAEMLHFLTQKRRATAEREGTGAIGKGRDEVEAGDKGVCKRGEIAEEGEERQHHKQCSLRG